MRLFLFEKNCRKLHKFSLIWFVLIREICGNQFFYTESEVKFINAENQYIKK